MFLYNSNGFVMVLFLQFLSFSHLALSIQKFNYTAPHPDSYRDPKGGDESA